MRVLEVRQYREEEIVLIDFSTPPSAALEMTGVLPSAALEMTGVLPSAALEMTGVLPSAALEMTGVLPSAMLEMAIEVSCSFFRRS